MLVWVILPPNFDSTKKYPALLYCQGGPQSSVSQFFSYRWNFQMMAAHDYIIVAPNRRGLPGFGHEWNDQISGDYGGQNMKDYVSAVNAVKTEPYIDEDHIGAVGASYGGFSVYWLAGHNQDSLFKAFIAHQLHQIRRTCGAGVFHPTPYWFSKTDAISPCVSNGHLTLQKVKTLILLASVLVFDLIRYVFILTDFCFYKNKFYKKIIFFALRLHFCQKIRSFHPPHLKKWGTPLTVRFLLNFCFSCHLFG